MTTVIAFSPSGTPAFFTFNRASAGEAYALSLSTRGPTFVFGRITEKSLTVLTSAQLIEVYNAAHPDEEPIKKLSGPKRHLVERVLPLITTLARPGEVPTTQGTGTMATKKKSAAKKSTTAAKKKDAPAKKGRAPNFTGMKLYKTTKGESRKWQEGSRRAASFAAITKGMRYETALEKGAIAADIVIMVKDGVLEVRKS